MKNVSRMRKSGLLDRIASQRMEKMELKKSHRLIIDHVISADSHCGAMYGEVAYRMGMEDGIRLMSEIRGLGHRQNPYF